jgi:hypothetical protein
MARDNSPKERQQKQLERKQDRRASYDRILIISEGSKTEPNYFREIRAAYRLHTANVEVRPSELGTAPIQVVQYAKALFENGDRHKNIQRRAFEKVFAVFDRDDHASYHDALSLAASLNGKLKNDAKQSIVKRHIPDYEKGTKNSFSITNEHLTVAIQRAERLATCFTAHTDPEPFTAIDALVKLMTSLRT